MKLSTDTEVEAWLSARIVLHLVKFFQRWKIIYLSCVILPVLKTMGLWLIAEH